jgi:hypothetical protein
VTTRVLYLGGLGRSGTTLIERVLGELPGVVALGEVVHLWQRDIRDDERCGCGSRFSACAFWTEVGEKAFGGWERADVHRILALRELVERTRHIPLLVAARRGDFAALVGEYSEYYAKIYAAAAAVAGASVVIDSSKHSALAHCLRHSSEIDLRVLHVVRDPRGVAYSWTKTVARPETDGAEEMTRYTPARSAVLWNAHNAAFGLLRQRGVSVRRLRYEDFVAAPRETIDKVAAFVGIDTSALELDFLRGNTVHLGQSHSAAGNPMRFTTGEVQLRADEAWRRALPPRQRALVGAVCAPLIRAYGYPLTSGVPASASRRHSAADLPTARPAAEGTIYAASTAAGGERAASVLRAASPAAGEKASRAGGGR